MMFATSADSPSSSGFRPGPCKSWGETDQRRTTHDERKAVGAALVVRRWSLVVGLSRPTICMARDSMPRGRLGSGGPLVGILQIQRGRAESAVSVGSGNHAHRVAGLESLVL